VPSSPRLVLHPLTAREAEQWLAAPELSSLSFPPDYPSTFATELLRLVALYPITDQAADEPGSDWGPWLLHHREHKLVVGVISCARTADPAEVSVGYDVAPSYWGNGYATEALIAVITHLFGSPEIRRVRADTEVGHHASRRVMEKAGMRWQRDEVESQGDRQLTLAHYAINRP
jgi:RimJ/RimL family protein N-acetyltransferase